MAPDAGIQFVQPVAVDDANEDRNGGHSGENPEDWSLVATFLYIRIK